MNVTSFSERYITLPLCLSKATALSMARGLGFAAHVRFGRASVRATRAPGRCRPSHPHTHVFNQLHRDRDRQRERACAVIAEAGELPWACPLLQWRRRRHALAIERNLLAELEKDTLDEKVFWGLMSSLEEFSTPLEAGWPAQLGGGLFAVKFVEGTPLWQLWTPFRKNSPRPKGSRRAGQEFRPDTRTFRNYAEILNRHCFIEARGVYAVEVCNTRCQLMQSVCSVHGACALGGL
jgi:hypothetical protein